MACCAPAKNKNEKLKALLGKFVFTISLFGQQTKKIVPFAVWKIKYFLYSLEEM